MAGHTLPVHLLSEKIEIAIPILAQERRIRDSTQAALAESLDVAPSTITLAMTMGRMSQAVADKFAELCHFRPSDPRWVDATVRPSRRCCIRDGSEVGYPGRDTPESFEEMLIDGLSGSRVRLDAYSFKLANERLLRFEIDDAGQSTAMGAPFQLVLQLFADFGRPTTGVTFGFKRLQIRPIVRAPDSRVRFTRRLGRPEPVVIRDASLRSTGSEKQPVWELVAQSNALYDEYVTADDPLCLLEEFSLHDNLVVEVAVNVRDRNFLWVDTSSLDIEEATRLAIEMILKSEVDQYPEDEMGWKVLGTHRIRARIDRAPTP